MLKNYLLLCIFAVVATVVHAQTPVVNAKKRTGTITIDGNPNEANWEFTNNITKAIIGTPNNTSKFAVLWDSLNLYVAFTITDANKYNESTNNWDDDAVEIYIDAENNGGTSYGTNDRQFVKEWNSSAIWEKAGKTTNVQHAWTTTTNGYAVEIRIPWSNIGITNPAAGFTIGFDVACDDDDNGGARESQQMWSGDNDNWQYTRNFGDLVLVSSDTQAPTAPSGLAASSITQSSLTLGWTASTDNIGVAGYDVYRNGTKLNSSLVTTTSYSVTGLTAATAYQFYVQAKDAAGNTSTSSNTVNVTTPDTQAPSTPTNLAASSLTQSSLTLTWTGSTDNVAVSGYDVYLNGTKINSSLITATSYSVTGLNAATAYQFYVQAKDAAGNASANSSVLSVMTPDTQAPSSPTGLVYSGLTQSSLTLSWNAATDNVAVTGYDVYRNGTKINSSPVTSTTYSVTGLNAGTTYNFYVQARDAAGNLSGNSNTVSITTPDTQAPTAPSSLSATGISQTALTLNWSAATDNVGVTGYDIYQDNVKINASPVTATSFAVSGLTANTIYIFYVQAYDAAGNTSAGSGLLNIQTPPPPDTEAPSAPTTLAASNITQSSLTLSWDASSDNVAVTGYDIYRNGVKLNSTTVTTTTYNVTGLAASTSYDFVVTARDAANNVSTNSNIVTVTTPDTQAPTSPSNLTAGAITQTSLTLNWTASTDNVGVIGYDLFQDNVKINASPITTTIYAVSGLTANTGYAFYIQARDAAGNTSNSAVINATTLLPPDVEAPSAPSNLTASAITQNSLTLTWTASTDDRGVAGYDVYRNGVRLNTSLVTTISYNVTGLNASAAYSFYIQAKDAAGNTSANSNTADVTTPDTQAPVAPTSLAASNVTASALTLNWSASTDNVAVAGYDVYQNGTKINASPVTTTSYNVTGLVQATSYSFLVRAFDAAGNFSSNSNTVSVTTPDTQAPTAPTGLSSSGLSPTTVNLSWTAATDNVGVSGYDVYRNGTKINGSVVTNTTYSVTGLTASTAYSFYVQARDAAANISGNSNTISITTPSASGCTGTGAINFQKWNNVSGTAVSNLTSNASYPNSPSTSGTLTSFEIPTNGGDNYGMKVYGYICPPATGTYTFWIASDDNSELWLSTSSNPANKTRIAYQTSWTNSREWNKQTTQKSAAITLTAGQLYYVEALMKEGSQGDNMAVGWAKPGQSNSAPSEVIPGSQLVSQLPDTQAPSVATSLTASNITQNSLTLTWTAATDNVAVTGYDVYQNGVKVNSSNITTTTYNVTGLSASTTYSFYIVAKDAASNTSASNAINATTATPDTQAPAAPTNLSANNLTQVSATISWTAATDNVGVTGYDVYRNGTKVNTSLVTGNSYSATGLTAATTYTFTVVAKDAAGNSSNASAPLSVTTLIPVPGSETFTQRTVIANQRMPHDLVYGPDNNIWYTERFAGRVSFVNPSTGAKTVVLTLGSNLALVGGQDGLMGLALHPQFRQGKPYVYISYTYQSTSATVRKTRIARYTYDSVAKALGQAVTILEDIPGSNDHNSARLAIGPDLKLYYSVGDMGAGQFDNLARTNNAQNLNIYEGKILRLNTEAISSSWIPTDNPFTNTSGQKTAVYSYGHRNPQGLVWGNVNGANILYSSEHGPYSDDEINIIENGRNYGWPYVSGFCDGNYNGRFLGGVRVVNEQNNCTTMNVKEPIRSLFPSMNPPDSTTSNMTWPSTGTCGTEFYGSNAIPGWQNSLLVANLKNGTVSRFKLSNDGLSIISDTIHYFRGLGRFRDVIVSPDGLKIYVACDSSGSTSGPTGGVTSTPANPGSILEFTYQPASGSMVSRQLLTQQVSDQQEEVKDRSMEVYPNPASSYFVVYNYSNEQGRTMELVDLNGKSIKRQSLVALATRVNVNNLANGLYVLKITDAKGKLVRTEKIVVQK